jgi:hydroxyacylglutathione hydrolase
MKITALEVGSFLSNCYIVADEKSRLGMVVDPGASPKRILDVINEQMLTIKYIVATHAHMDHVSAVNEVKKATNAIFAIHSADARLLARGGGMGLFGPAAKPDLILDGNSRIEFGSLSFSVLETPGHSPGGICLVGHGIVFTGDTLFRQGIGRYDFPGCSGRDLMDSIRKKLMVLPDATAVYPGHGPATTIGLERTSNPFLNNGGWMD